MENLHLSQEQAENVERFMDEEVLVFDDYREWADNIDDFCAHFNVAWWRFSVPMRRESQAEFRRLRSRLMRAIEQVQE